MTQDWPCDSVAEGFPDMQETLRLLSCKYKHDKCNDTASISTTTAGILEYKAALYGRNGALALRQGKHKLSLKDFVLEWKRSP